MLKKSLLRLFFDMIDLSKSPSENAEMNLTETPTSPMARLINKWRVLLVLLTVAATIAGMIAPFIYTAVSYAADHNIPLASGYFRFAVVPLFVMLPYLLVSGGVSATAISSGRRGLPRGLLVTLAAILIVGGVSFAVFEFMLGSKSTTSSRPDNIEYLRVMPKSEMINLIDSCTINYFTKTKKGVYVEYAYNTDGNEVWIYKAQRADPAGYADYVRASDDTSGDCGARHFDSE